MINVIAELERIGWDFEFASEQEVKCKCPFHDDNSPSCHINVEKRVFKCQTAGCGKAGDFISFLARALRTGRKVVMVDLAKRYDIDTSKIVNPEVVERYHTRIKKAGPLLKELRDRGVGDKLIRRYRLGENEGRITIPIKNEAGDFVNIRKYLPGAPGAEKMRNLRGHGKIRLFPIDQLKYDELLICGGEMKAIVAAEQLNPHGIGCVTATAGEGNWDQSLNSHFIGKKVWVCYDVDEEGQKSAYGLCATLSHHTRWVGNVLLPLNVDKYPHGDINDFVAGENGSLKRELNKAEQWEAKQQLELEDTEPTPMSISEASHARNAKERFEVKAVVSAIDVAPYTIPKVVKPCCEKDQKMCGLCPIAANDQPRVIHPESAAILEMVSRSKGAQREALMQGIGIPMNCPTVTFEADEFYNVEDVRLSPQLEITNRASDRVMQPAVAISDGLELNETYKMIGRMHPHPMTQQATLMISGYETSQDALSSYVPTDLEELEIFQPREWTKEGIQEKLKDIYGDLSANVTRIFERDEIHLIIDLAYHSPLFIRFDGKDVKGWVEVLIIGDSSQGKSETFLCLRDHYGLGEKIECKNASVAGLLGGLQQMGNKWFVSWGIIPTHDKRLVCLEEVKGTSTEVLARLTDMRSSGIAEIDKIEKRRTHARTRIIALSNPRSDLPISAYNFGVESIKELIGGLEDVRRFDAHLIVGASDIDSDKLNMLQRSRPHVDHVFTGDLCRRLILWSWTREPEQVIFEDESYVLERATELSNRFSDLIPILDRGSTRYKIGRLAASLAARTFSRRDDCLLVRTCHVEAICDLLTDLYCRPSFGYDDFTEAVNLTTRLVDPDSIRKKVIATPFPEDFIKQVLHTTRIDMIDICDWCAWERTEAQELLSFLVRKHAFVRDGRSYRKTSPFITLLKELLAKGDFPKRPDFIPEEF